MDTEERFQKVKELLEPTGTPDTVNIGYDGKYHYDTTPMDTGNKNSSTGFSFDPLVKKMLKRLGEEPGSLLIVDFGCGVGWLVEYLTTEYSRHCVLGIEISENCVNRMKERGIPAVRFDLVKLPEEIAGLIDIGFSRGVLHHTPEPKSALKGIMRSIRPKGILYLSIYSGIWWHKFVQYFLHPILMFLCKNKIGFFFVKYIMAGLFMPIYWVLSKLRSGKGVTFQNTFNQFSDLFLNTRVLFLDWKSLVNEVANELQTEWEIKFIGSDILGAMDLFQLERQ